MGSNAGTGRRRPAATTARLVVPVVLLLCGLLTPIGAAAASSTGHHDWIAAPGAFDAIVPDRSVAARAATDAATLRYEIVAAFDPDAGVLDGELRLDFVNSTDDRLREVYFRLIPNADAGAVEMSLTAIEVDGSSLADPERYRTASWMSVRVPLEAALAPGASVTVGLGFRVAFAGPAFYGLLGPSTEIDAWSLIGWYPMLAGYDQWSGWQLDGAMLWGGLTSASLALYDVTLTMPADLNLAASGSLVEEETDEDLVTRRYLAGPIQDFVAVAGDFRAFDETVGETTVTVYVEPGRAEIGRAALVTAVESLAAYQERFGAYPRTDLALVGMPLFVAAGVAYEGLILFDARMIQEYSFLDPEGADVSASELGRLEQLVAHEVGHQWWGCFVASDYARHAFMVEGLTQYVSILYVGWTHGEAAAERTLISEVAEPYAEIMEYYGDAVPDLSAVGEDELAGGDPGYIYGKAALGFMAIHQEIGDDAFFAALDAYAEEYAFGFAEPADLRLAFEEAANEDLGEIWRFWFEGDDVTVDDVRELLRAA